MFLDKPLHVLSPSFERFGPRVSVDFAAMKKIVSAGSRNPVHLVGSFCFEAYFRMTDIIRHETRNTHQHFNWHCRNVPKNNEHLLGTSLPPGHNVGMPWLWNLTSCKTQKSKAAQRCFHPPINPMCTVISSPWIPVAIKINSPASTTISAAQGFLTKLWKYELSQPIKQKKAAEVSLHYHITRKNHETK